MFALSQVAITTISHTENQCSTPQLPTGDFPEVDDKGQEKWPRGDEKSWKAALRDVNSGPPTLCLYRSSCD